MESKYIWLLDPGHGGMIDGEYQTAGKRSPVWEDGSQYFEGVGNRQIVKKMLLRLKEMGIDAKDIVSSEKDIPLITRVGRANNLHRRSDKKCIYISIHSDGFHKESAKGYSVYTSIGETDSDKIAEVFLNNLKLNFPRKKMRTDPRDGDKDKEANFYVLRKTACPAILIENFFMTNESNCRDILMTEDGQNKIVESHIQSILDIEKNGIK